MFQPGHRLPTESLEDLADRELADALERQERDKVQDEARENEDPDDEDVIEAKR